MQKMLTKLSNMMLKPLLKSPLHFFASGGMMLITFTGRKSGKVYTTPVQYTREENTVTFFTFRERVWWKNLQDNAGVTLHLKGRKVEGMVETLIFDEGLIAQAMRARYPRISEEKAADYGQKMLIIKIGIGG
jgi:deazaflavin-dependent oxidoreductase (nitroreductase family)